MANAKLDLKIVPFRGEYYDLAPFRTDYLRGFIYPVPDPRFPFLGVHFTRRMAGGIEAGPNAVLALTREGYSKRAFDAGDVIEFAVFPGFWIMAAKYWQTSLGRVLSFVEQSGLRPSPTTADARYHGGRFDSRRLGSSSSRLGETRKTTRRLLLRLHRGNDSCMQCPFPRSDSVAGHWETHRRHPGPAETTVIRKATSSASSKPISRKELQ
jgi:hypothetical protein